MKKIIFLLFVFTCLISCKSQVFEQESVSVNRCNCFREDNRFFIAAQVSLKNNQKDTLSAHCADVIRAYMDMGEGREREKSVISCVSKETRDFIITDKTEFFTYNGADRNYLSDEAKESFFELMKNPQNFFNIEYDIRGNILSVRKFYIGN